MTDEIFEKKLREAAELEVPGALDAEVSAMLRRMSSVRRRENRVWLPMAASFAILLGAGALWQTGRYAAARSARLLDEESALALEITCMWDGQDGYYISDLETESN